MTSIPEDRRAEQGIWLFLASLSVFFFSSIFLYAIYVLLRLGPEAGSLQSFRIPSSFALTTVILLATSGVLHLGLIAIRNEKQGIFRCCALSAFGLSLLFLAIQAAGLLWMMEQQMSPSMQAKNLYGLTLVLVLLHALHVVGGVAGLALLLFGLVTSAYDHERHFMVKGCVIYWHFLDVVWLVMLGSFLLAAWVSRAAPT
jgi:heme/copper-type cytochrome/quinol oxidase subunit 3